MSSIPLSTKRHSLAHLMAHAVQELYPDAQFAIGPDIDNGWYYDIDFGTEKISEDDFAKIEKRMKELVKANMSFSRVEATIKEALEWAKENNQPYKTEIINDLAKEGNTSVSFYTVGKFKDLCRGPHVEHTKDIDTQSFKLHKLAGAYWRGDEHNKMLTRIYGLAFENKTELEDYLTMLVEAEKRDHRKLGQQLELFMFHETAPGMPYWLPKGLTVYNELVNYWRTEHNKLGYQEISSPLVNKAELWQISGHWEHYKDDMFIADMGENEVYGIKPMNCPNAMLVFKSKPRSYRELPLRLSDTDRLHRYERSGTLNGLFRVRSFQQDDSHNFISEDMIASEYNHIFEVCKNFYSIFNLEYSFRLGTRPEKFLGEKAVWDKAESALTDILKKSGKEYIIAEGDGAFYGPKIDILMKDCLGRDWQMGTIQLDFQLPQRFNLEYTSNDGTKKTPVVVHRVIYGSLERFIGILIEHLAGEFPVWLSPVQIKLLSVSEGHVDYCLKLKEELTASGIRVELDTSNETVGKKIREASGEKVPYMLVIGDKEMNSDKLFVRERGEREAKEWDKQEFIATVIKQNKERN